MCWGLADSKRGMRPNDNLDRLDFRDYFSGHHRTSLELSAVRRHDSDTIFDGETVYSSAGRDAAWGTAPEGTAAWYFQNGVIQASLTMSRFIFSSLAAGLAALAHAVNLKHAAF